MVPLNLQLLIWPLIRAEEVQELVLIFRTACCRRKSSSILKRTVFVSVCVTTWRAPPRRRQKAWTHHKAACWGKQLSCRRTWPVGRERKDGVQSFYFLRCDDIIKSTLYCTYLGPAALVAQQVRVEVRHPPRSLVGEAPHQLPVAHVVELLPSVLRPAALFKQCYRLAGGQDLREMPHSWSNVKPTWCLECIKS